MSFFDTRMGYYKFWELKKKIWDEKKKSKSVFKIVYISRGGAGVKANLEKVYI